MSTPDTNMMPSDISVWTQIICSSQNPKEGLNLLVGKKNPKCIFIINHKENIPSYLDTHAITQL